jgi:hypothetical protein
MKKLILFLSVLALISCMQLSGQIKMDCNGHIGLGKDPDSFWNIDINGNTRMNGSLYNHGQSWSYDRVSFLSNVGIGFGLPSDPYILVVDGGDSYFFEDIRVMGNSNLNGNVGLNHSASTSYNIYSYGTSYHSGSFGIGVTPNSSVATLSVGSGSASTSIYAYGDIKINGASVIASDERYKKNINSIPNSLDILMKIDGKTYDFKDQKELRKMYDDGKIKFYEDTIVDESVEIIEEPYEDTDGTNNINREKNKKSEKFIIKPVVPNFRKGKQYGLIAQEVEKVLPECVLLDSIT